MIRTDIAEALTALAEHQAVDAAFAEGWHAALTAVRVRLEADAPADRDLTIVGAITLEDGSTSEFMIESDNGGWHQWGATRERLGRTSDLMDRLAAAAFEAPVTA